MQEANSLHRYSLRFGGILLLATSLLICVDVLLRKFAGTTIGGADELAGYSLAIATSWGLGAALADRAHVRIDTVYALFPRRLRVACDVFGILLFLAFFGLIAWYGFDIMTQSWTSSSRSNSALQTPIAVPQIIWIAGLLVCLVTSAALLYHAWRRIRSGDWQGASRLIGTRSVAEELQEEITSLPSTQGAQQ